uniref:Uncharacterized protein n=1 Tax=viral metagenome TaxID=1070528 RepID=A0A6M3LR49_9ZZZZ
MNITKVQWATVVINLAKKLRSAARFAKVSATTDGLAQLEISIQGVSSARLALVRRSHCGGMIPECRLEASTTLPNNLNEALVKLNYYQEVVDLALVARAETAHLLVVNTALVAMADPEVV